MTYVAAGEIPSKYAFYRITREDVIAKCKEAPQEEKQQCIEGAVKWFCTKDSSNPYKDDYGEDCEQGAHIFMEQELTPDWQDLPEGTQKKASLLLWGGFGLLAAITVGMAVAANKEW
jgi:hypothetical protein